MNAGRDVERLIADWLVEEAHPHAPDRILHGAARSIDHTKQRRFAVAWREPMIVSMSRLVAAAVFLVVAVVGAGLIGRSTASPGQAPTASALPGSQSAAPSPSAGVTLEQFRAARNRICAEAMPTAQALLVQFDNPYDPTQTATQRAAKVAVLEQIITLSEDLRSRLQALPVPAEMAADQAAALARNDDVAAILSRALLLLRAGKLAEAQAVDLVTDPINRQVEAFERKYSLDPCP